MKGRGSLEDLNIDEKIILKCLLEKSYRISRVGFTCLRTGTSFAFLCARQLNFAFRLTRKLLDQLRNCYLFKNDRFMEVVGYYGWYSDAVFCQSNITCRN